MSEPRIDIEQTGGIVIVRFAHQPTRNALDRDSRAALVDRLADWDADPQVRTVILTGLDPAFTSGVDAKQLLSDDYTALPRNPADALRAMETPTIAAVNGACVSGGLEIAIACSFIIASERAFFADTHARLGIVPGWGLSAELPAAVGVARARQLTLTGEPVDAATASRWGLVNEVVAHEALIPRCLELAGAVARLDPEMAAAATGLYREGQNARLDSARRAERALHDGWDVDRAAARRRFGQSVSPPST